MKWSDIFESYANIPKNMETLVLLQFAISHLENNPGDVASNFLWVPSAIETQKYLYSTILRMYPAVIDQVKMQHRMDEGDFNENWMIIQQKLQQLYRNSH